MGLLQKVLKALNYSFVPKKFPWDPPPAILDYESTQLYTEKFRVDDSFGLLLLLMLSLKFRIITKTSSEDTTKFPLKPIMSGWLAKGLDPKRETPYCHSIQTLSREQLLYSLFST